MSPETTTIKILWRSWPKWPHSCWMKWWIQVCIKRDPSPYDQKSEQLKTEAGGVLIKPALRGAHTEQQRQRLIQVNGDAWEWVWDPFSSGTIHSNETLPLPLTLPLGVFIPLGFQKVITKRNFHFWDRVSQFPNPRSTTRHVEDLECLLPYPIANL